MKPFGAFALCLFLFALIPERAFSQSAEKRFSVAGTEIHLIVEHTTHGVTVESDPAPNAGGISLPVTVYDHTNATGADWAAEMNCAAGDENSSDFDCNELVEFSFTAGSSTFDFQWYQCTNSPGGGFNAMDDFYCPHGDGDHNDIAITYTTAGEFTIELLGQADPADGDAGVILGEGMEWDDEDWVWPYDMVTVCGGDGTGGGYEDDCIDDADTISGFFFTSQTPSTRDYKFKGDLIVKVGAAGPGPTAYSSTWNWEGVTARLADGAEIIVQGTFDASGGTVLGVYDASSTWGGLEFESGSEGSFDDVTIERVDDSFHALRIFDASPEFEELTISLLADASGVYVYGSSAEPFFSGSSVGGTGSHNGFDFTSTASGILHEVTLKVDETAVSASYYSDPFLHGWPGQAGGENEIDGGWAGLSATYSATIYAGGPTYSGSNRMCDTPTYDLAASSAAVYAQGNYWEDYPPNTLGGGSFYHSNLGSPSPACSAPLGKQGPASRVKSLRSHSEVVRALELIATGRGLGGEDAQIYFDRAGAILREVVHEDPGTSESRSALVALFRLSRIAGGQAYREVLEEVSRGEADHSTALGLLVLAYDTWGEKELAVAAAAALRNSFTEDWERDFAEYHLSRLTTNARPEDLPVLTGPPPSDLAKYGRAIEPAPSSALGYVDQTKTIEAKLYPNPFNPSAVLVFNLPTAGAVDVTVFDLLGRQLRYSSLGHLPAGQNEIVLPRESLPSGTYIMLVSSGELRQSLTFSLVR